MSYRVHGEIPRIRVPAPSPPRINIRLWQHTCFEAFIAVQGRSAYHEFNFAPSGEWAVYAFSAYRDGGPLADETLRPDINVRSTDTLLELDAAIALDAISAMHPRAALRIGLSAIVEADDRLSYWGLSHPAAKPDFHNPDGFVLLIPPLRARQT